MSFLSNFIQTLKGGNVENLRKQSRRPTTVLPNDLFYDEKKKFTLEFLNFSREEIATQSNETGEEEIQTDLLFKTNFPTTDTNKKMSDLAKHIRLSLASDIKYVIDGDSYAHTESPAKIVIVKEETENPHFIRTTNSNDNVHENRTSRVVYVPIKTKLHKTCGKSSIENGFLFSIS